MTGGRVKRGGQPGVWVHMQFNPRTTLASGFALIAYSPDKTILKTIIYMALECI